MREIKFRAWDKKYREFIKITPVENGGMFCHYKISSQSTPDHRVYDGVSGKNIFLTLDGHVVAITPWDEKTTCVRIEERYVLMQYTGLKDKNGKEIYEGDIVYKEILARDDPACGFYGDKLSIVYEDGGFLAKEDEHAVIAHYLHIVAEDCEVIGNIYENPELLPARE